MQQNEEVDTFADRHLGLTSVADTKESTEGIGYRRRGLTAGECCSGKHETHWVRDFFHKETFRYDLLGGVGGLDPIIRDTGIDIVLIMPSTRICHSSVSSKHSIKLSSFRCTH